MTYSTASVLSAGQSSDREENTTRLQLQCPNCQTLLRQPESNSPSACPGCRFLMLEEDGIIRALPPEREEHYRQFIKDYETVRTQEGRGSSSSDYYLSLPFEDLTGRNSWQWQIRARTFACLEQRILPLIERAYPQGCDVLDIGAGNCWLSYRLALRGHRPVAVDLLDNGADGLRAATHYFPNLPGPFARFVAEMDRLPFWPGQFDVVIFNASLHYSVDYYATLRETLRCLRCPGFVIIADSPFYSREESGQAMLGEKRAAFQKQFGFPSNSIPSLEYLTADSLKNLEERLSLRWKFLTPWYGLNWAMRPWKARLQRRREPSRFHLIWSEMER